MLQWIRHYLRYTSIPIALGMIALMAIGIAAIGVSQQAEAVGSGHMTKQIIYSGLGLGVFVLMVTVPYHRIGRIAYPLFAVTLALLVLVLLLPEKRGSHRWIDLKVFQLQPSEVAKLSFIILLAWYLRLGDHYRSLVGLIPPFLLTLIPMGLILKEPDLGTSLLLLPTLYVMLFMAGAKLKHLLSIVAVATVLVLLPVPVRVAKDDLNKTREWRLRKELAYWTFDGEDKQVLLCAAPLVKMHGHQLERIAGWIRQDDPELAKGIGYQLHKSKMVMGAGHWTGRGDWNTSQRFFRVLPDDHTDFIFSVVGGQWGLVGSMGVLLLYCVILLLGMEIAVITYDPFGRLLAVGVLALLFSQIVINVGMTMGLLPITGMTLPLVSYGGSSLLVNCAALGLLVNVGLHRPVMFSRRPFEHDEKGEKPPAPYGPLAGGNKGLEKTLSS